MKEKDKIVANKSLLTAKENENTVGLSEFVFEMAGAVFTALIVVLLIKEMATHSCTLAWKIPWMEEPVGYSL